MAFKWHIVYGDLGDLRGELTMVAELPGKGCLVRTCSMWDTPSLGRTTSEAVTWVPGAALSDFKGEAGDLPIFDDEAA